MTKVNRPYLGALKQDGSMYVSEPAAYHEVTQYITVELYSPQSLRISISVNMIEQPVPDLPGHVAVVQRTIIPRWTKHPVISTISRVTDGKNRGRANTTNCLTQAMRDGDSLYLTLKQDSDASVGRTPSYVPMHICR